MPGLTDNQQTVLVLVSAILIVVGTTTIPEGTPWYVGLILGIVGAVGLAIKDYLGTPESKGGTKPAAVAN